MTISSSIPSTIARTVEIGVLNSCAKSLNIRDCSSLLVAKSTDIPFNASVKRSSSEIELLIGAIASKSPEASISAKPVTSLIGLTIRNMKYQAKPPEIVIETIAAINRETLKEEIYACVICDLTLTEVTPASFRCSLNIDGAIAKAVAMRIKPFIRMRKLCPASICAIRLFFWVALIQVPSHIRFHGWFLLIHLNHLHQRVFCASDRRAHPRRESLRTILLPRPIQEESDAKRQI